jgi:hypothetical protein
VVLPAWTLELAAAERALILAHEEEHSRARDPLLLALGALAVAALPWNPVVWWQTRRLRAAVELDCDARVLRRGAEPLAYGALLLRVGSRSGRDARLLAAALGESRGSILERRLTMITRDVRMQWRKAVLGGAAAVALVVVACETPKPSPTEPVPPAKALAQTTSMTGDAPLVLVDGVEQPWRVVGPAMVEKLAAMGIASTDIARIEVVKDPAATEVFGAKGKGGVIQIYTKTGAIREITAKWEQPPTAAPALKVIVNGQETSWADAKPEMGSHPREGSVLLNGARVPIQRMEVLAGEAAAPYGVGKVLVVTTK